MITRQQIPNLITSLRLALVPVLLLLAYSGYHTSFIVVLAVCFFSDLLDGVVARLLGAASEFGARFDSVVDFVFYVCIPVAAWWLWPELLTREWGYFATVLASICLPPLIAFAKFRAVPSYHTWGAKLAAATVGLSLLALFAIGVAWPFRIAAVISIVAALDEIAITMLLKSPSSNVRSVAHVVRRRMS